jgi:hypothetical protein
MIIQAKILDSTHLELSQPLAANPGETVLVSISDTREEDSLWREISKKHFLEAYDDQDAIYDTL